jgi:hypothetical protein
MGWANHPLQEPRGGAATVTSMRCATLRVVGFGAFSLCGLVRLTAHSGHANSRPHFLWTASPLRTAPGLHEPGQAGIGRGSAVGSAFASSARERISSLLKTLVQVPVHALRTQETSRSDLGIRQPIQGQPSDPQPQSRARASTLPFSRSSDSPYVPVTRSTNRFIRAAVRRSDERIHSG